MPRGYTSTLIPGQVPQPPDDTECWDPEPADEQNDNDPADNDDEAFGLPASVEDSDVLQGLQDSCN
jgi:hypothetical protein